MNLSEWLLSLRESEPLIICMGFFAGSLAGLFGVGGGILTTPFLNLIGLPMPLAVATSAPVIAANSISATLANRKLKKVEWRLGLAFALFMIPSVELSARILRMLQGSGQSWIDTLLRLIFIAVVFLSVFVVAKHREEKKDAENWMNLCKFPPMIPCEGGHEVSLWVLAPAGLLAGMIAGMLGLGGGRVIVPVLLASARIGLKRSIGTSSFIILISSIFAASTYLSKGMVDTRISILLICGAVFGAATGAWVMHRSPAGGLRKLYLALTFLALVALVLKEFGLDAGAFGVLVFSSAGLMLTAYWMAFRSQPENTA